MKKCKFCNINITDDNNVCPLCKKRLESSSITYQTYPIIANIKKYNIAINIMVIISIVAIFTCILVNLLTSRHFLWCILCIIGIIYSWITTMYSIKINTNIASHVLLQCICISIITIIIDFIIGYSAWSLNYAIPIILQVSNITMLILLIITHKKYFKYIIYQLILTFLSIFPLIFYEIGLSSAILPISITIWISLITLILSFILAKNQIKSELIRRFHI